MLLKLQKKNKKKIIFKLFDSESLKQAHKRIFFSTLVFILIYISILIKLTNVMVISNLSKELDTNNSFNYKVPGTKLDKIVNFYKLGKPKYMIEEVFMIEMVSFLLKM